MSVYIKGMEMPFACSNCAFCEESYFYAGAYCRISDDDDMMSINEIRSKRRDNCPICPVPPHGRLIDADALMNKVIPKNNDARFKCVPLKDLIDGPTIIEAEEGE